MSELVRSAVKGAAVGWTLGASQRGKKTFTRLTFFDPVPLRMAQSDALDSWHVWAAHLKAGKPPEALADSWAACWHGRSEEGGFGLMNLRRGLRPGLSGAYANPLGEGSEALGRAVFWGLVFHGDPEAAARWAVASASIDHFGDGVAVAALVAWWTAIAKPGTSITDFVAVANALLPVESLATRSLQAALSRGTDPDAAKNLHLTLPVQLGLVDTAHAALSLAWIMCGLQAGVTTWGSGPMVAAGCGAASDQTSMVCGTLATLLSGGVPEEWSGVIGDEYVAGHSLVGIDSSRSLSALADLVVGLAPAPVAVAEPAPAVVAPLPVADTTSAVEEPSADGSVQEPEPVVPVVDPTPVVPQPAVPSSTLLARMNSAKSNHSGRVGDFLVDVAYLSPPAVKPGGSLQLQLTMTNTGPSDQAVDPKVSVPDGWQVAHRMQEFLAQPGRPTTFVMVAQAPADWPARPTTITLHIGDGDFPLPVLAAERWHAIGPFANNEDLGYEKSYGPETEQRSDQTLSSRSGLPLKWKTEFVPGTVIEVEPYFDGGPGVVYLFATAKLPRAGHHRVFAACDAGVVVWIDGKKCVGYFDRTKPVPRYGPPYIGECVVADSTKVLVKVVRGREPVGPLYLSFYNEDGEVVGLSDFEVLA
ncbi:MAG: ADP-ribosylglycohydrolase family protein [Armatimonadetes bacterium]|nr:ADP-ribosylglycohydrolase family protein [Armatimonadota bacterium]